MTISSGLLLFAMPVALFAQTAAFEVASVKSLPPVTDGRVSTRMSTDDGMVRYSNVTLKDVIAQAWGIAKFRIEGPAWLDDERYTIAAKIPSGASSQQVPGMFQTLLRERFAMEFHRESKDVPVLALVVAKGGSKLKAADALTGCSGSSNLKRIILACHTSLQQFAEQLSRHTDRPVVDKTLLQGAFEINLQWIPDGAAPDDSVVGATLQDALPEQLGLKLEAQKAPVEILVIESANKIPTEN